MKPSTALRILSPRNGDKVKFKHRITGVVEIPDAEVQVLVYSHDAKWYKQAPAVVEGSTFSLDAVFGFEDSQGLYLIIAIAGNVQVNPAEEIPDGLIRSKAVRVKREKLR